MPAVHVSQFHALWAELHRRPLRDPQSSILDPRTEMDWLHHFAARIPCRACRKHWLDITAKLPPPFADLSDESRRSLSEGGFRAAYFRWTVRVHNAINRLLKKPIVDLRTAKRRWHFDTFWNQKVTL